MINRLMTLYKTYAVHQYFYIRQATVSRRSRQVIFLMLTPILLLICCWNYFFERFFLKRIILNDERKNLHKDYMYNMVFAGIAKNEGSYIQEWIEFHRLVGVDRFVIYDNGSTDNMKDVLEPYVTKGIVDYVYLPGRAKQLDAYYDALKRYRKIAKWMGFIDLDEFVIPVEEGKQLDQVVEEVMETYPNAGGVAINWYVYGSSGFQKRPQGLVMENYLKRAEDDYKNNRCVKNIVNPRRIKGYLYDPHTPTYFYGFEGVNENGKKVDGPWNYYPDNSYKKLRINHYYCKSVEEGKIKFDRGLATHEQDVKNDWEKYNEFDRNEVYDDIILRYVEDVKKSLEKK